MELYVCARADRKYANSNLMQRRLKHSVARFAISKSQKIWDTFTAPFLFYQLSLPLSIAFFPLRISSSSFPIFPDLSVSCISSSAATLRSSLRGKGPSLSTQRSRIIDRRRAHLSLSFSAFRFSIADFSSSFPMRASPSLFISARSTLIS